MADSEWTKAFIAPTAVLPVVWLLLYILKRIKLRKGIAPTNPWLFILPVVGGLANYFLRAWASMMHICFIPYRRVYLVHFGMLSLVSASKSS